MPAPGRTAQVVPTAIAAIEQQGFAVTLVCPPGYPHILALIEIAETLHYALQSLGYDSIVTDKLDEPGRRHILLGANLLPKFNLGQPKPGSIIYNFEQIDEHSAWIDEAYLALLRTHEVWDYSERNIALLRQKGVDHIHFMPIGHVPELERIHPALVQDIDVLFYGSVNERRQHVLDDLRSRGLKVEQVFGLYGAERDKLVARAKIVLNVHFYESKIFEIARVSYLLTNSVCVVSETGLDPAEQAFSEGVAFAPYEALADACVELAGHPERRSRLGTRGRELMRERSQSHYLMQWLQNKAATPVASLSPLPLDDLARWVLDAVPVGAQQILLVGRQATHLAGALQAQDARRVIHCLDLSAASDTLHAPVAAGSQDLLILDDLLSHCSAPLATLRSLRQLLHPTGEILCRFPNAQHFSVLRGLLGGDFQHFDDGDPDQQPLRHFTFAGINKLLLDAGFAPSLVSTAQNAPAPDLLQAAGSLLQALRLDQARANTYLGIEHFLYRGSPLGWTEGESDIPLTFVVCVNNEEQLNTNLLRSPCLRQPGPHQLIQVRGAANAGEALNSGIEQAQHEIVVLLHQDVYLPPGWTQRLIEQYRQAERQFGHLGILGVFGVVNDAGQKREYGHIVDRHNLMLRTPLPARVDTIDEVLMVVPRNTPLRFEPALGWHLYGADFALQARARGLAVAAIDAPCFHHSRGGFVVPPEYHTSAHHFCNKWRAQLPVFTPCANFTR